MLFKVLSFTNLNHVTLIDKQTNCGILLSEGSSIDHLGNNTWLALATKLSFVTIKQTNVVGGYEMKFHWNKSVEIKHGTMAFPSTRCPSLPFSIHPVEHRRIDINFHISCDFCVWRFKWHSDTPEVIKEIPLIFHAGLCSQHGRISLFLTSVQMYYFCGCRPTYA